MDCRICGAQVTPFMSFGNMPIANGFLTADEFADEYLYELQPVFCEGCATFQIAEQPAPERMFHDRYAFYTRTSQRMVAHFKTYADWIRQRYLIGDDPFVVEIGSNDGAMLENFAEKGIRHLGIEPSANVAEEARRHGVRTEVEFFGPDLADHIVARDGHADALIAANVMCHIPDLLGVAEAADKLLKPEGVLVFEDPYLGDMVEKTAYDQIYDEHVFIFSALSVKNIFGSRNFELVDLEPQGTHGGSMRYVFARKGTRETSSRVEAQLAYEQKCGLHLTSTYENFRERCEASRDKLTSLLAEIRNRGDRIVGYAATSKSTTMLNYCGIGPATVEFISDTTPIKQGKYSPGVHIPVRSHEDFEAKFPDYALLLAWNHQEEITANEAAFLRGGGRWIVFVPEVAVLPEQVRE
jgi:methylation protein EvaC